MENKKADKINEIKSQMADMEAGVMKELLTAIEMRKDRVIDLTDIGDIVGKALKPFLNESEIGFDADSFISGFYHGIDSK